VTDPTEYERLVELAARAYKKLGTYSGTNARMRAAFSAIGLTAESCIAPIAERGRLGPYILVISGLDAGVCVGGRWDGWLMTHHPDGQWVSQRKLARIDPAARPQLGEL
jgi:hypothetical protein